MSYGLIVRNTLSQVLIDGERRHPLLYYETTTTLSPSGNIGAVDVPFPPTANPVLVTFFNHSSVPVILSGLGQTGNQYDRATFFVNLDAGQSATITMRVYEL